MSGNGPGRESGGTRREWMWLAVTIVALLAGAGLLGYFILQALDTGTVRLPITRGPAPIVSRDEKPALFFTGVGSLGLVAIACIGLALWLTGHALRAARGRH